VPEQAVGPIVLVAGSLRSGSYTKVLLGRAGQLVPDRFQVIESDDVRALPHYDADLDGERAPETVRRARATLATAAAVIIATPEYNSSIPGGLKNWVDWVTRPVRQHVLVGKPVAVLGGAPNARGAATAVNWLGTLLDRLGAVVAGVPLAVPEIATEIEPGGSVSDAVDRQLVDLIDALVMAIDAVPAG